MMIRVPLTRGQFALIDEGDAWVMRHSWHAVPRASTGGYYACATINKRKEYLHRVIMRAKPGDIIDHEDGNGLDCRRTNMRFADNSGNNANRIFPLGVSGFRGVSPHKKGFRARVNWHGSVTRGRCFGSPVDAARDYDRLARQIQGEFAVLNFNGGDR